jgi:hypothetical protein
MSLLENQVGFVIVLAGVVMLRSMHACMLLTAAATSNGTPPVLG